MATTVVCIDATSRKSRPTGLQYLRRYEVLCGDPVTTCVYCGDRCGKIDVGIGETWCRKRFALAPPGKDTFLETETEKELVHV